MQLRTHTCKQGHYVYIVPKLLMRSMLVGPSGSGKTVLLTNMILGICKGCFHEFIFGVHRLKLIQHGSQLRIIPETILSQMIKKRCCFDSHNPSELEQVLKTQHKVIDYQKEQKHTYLYELLIVIDDFADDANFTRKSQLLHQLYMR